MSGDWTPDQPLRADATGVQITSRLTPKKRKPSETARMYGPKAFREWIKREPCAVCGVRGYTEMAHTENGGKGRKADWTTIAPMCGARTRQKWERPLGLTDAGCHRQLHEIGVKSFEALFDVCLHQLARRNIRAWLDYSAPSPGVDPHWHGRITNGEIT